jgi:hypothetical protein
MKKGDNHKMMDPRMGTIAQQNAVIPGGPQNNNPMNVTNNSDGQSVQANSIYNDFPQNYGQMGTGMLNPEGVKPSQLLTQAGQPFVVGQGKNSQVAYGMQQQPDTSGSGPNTDMMESTRLAQYADMKGLPGGAMGLQGMPAVPGGLPGNMQGTSGVPLMPGVQSAESMVPGSTMQKKGQKKKGGKA